MKRLCLVMFGIGLVLLGIYLSSPTTIESSPTIGEEFLPDKHGVPAHRHMDPISPILLGMVIILIAAKIGGEVAHRLKQPPVMGELLLGILLGNVYFFTGWGFFNFLQHNTFLEYMGRFGALVLLCRVGLETDLGAMIRAGQSVFLVACGGVLLPCTMGYLVSFYLLPDCEFYARLVLSTALAATSIGITVRVLEDLGKIDTPEARIIVGAAITDDVLGLLILAVVANTITTGSLALGNVAATALFATLFVAVASVVSLRFSHVLGEYISRMRAEGMKLLLSVLTCLLLAYVADYIGLAPIIGAFAAGLILKDIRVKDLQGHEHTMDEMIRPAYLIFVPIFFVLMGSQVKLESFLDKKAVELSVSIAAVAILGKLLSGFCVLEKGVRRLCVGIGMIPRGEVGLIFASMGKTMGVLNDTLYSTLVIVFMWTTLITPPLLKKIIYNQKESKGYEPGILSEQEAQRR
ncbi:MAG TPA: cation:proton antiporter [Candidatus Brocadiales bacterium]|nr:cation:proton antiporter [Candidatus Brocadiales bacterium]